MTFEGISVVGGYKKGPLKNRGTSTYKDCNFFGGYDTASKSAGFIYNEATLILDNCILGYNYRENHGGAIYNNWSGKITIKNSLFKNNRTDYYGGAIYNLGNLDVENSKFENNESTKDSNGGGAIYHDKGLINISHCEFIDNKCDAYGSAIYNDVGAYLNIDNSKFNGNNGCGTIYNVYMASITNSTFENNIGEYYGAAICSEADIGLYIKDCTFKNNSSSGEYGGITIYNGCGPFTFAGTNTIEDSYIPGNAQGIAYSYTGQYGSVSFEDTDLIIDGDLILGENEVLTITDSTTAINESAKITANVILEDSDTVLFNDDFTNNGEVKITVLNDELDFNSTYKVCANEGTGIFEIEPKIYSKYTLALSIEDGYYVVKPESIPEDIPIDATPSDIPGNEPENEPEGSPEAEPENSSNNGEINEPENTASVFSNGNLGIIIGGCVVLIIAVVACVIVSKKKKI